MEGGGVFTILFEDFEASQSTCITQFVKLHFCSKAGQPCLLLAKQTISTCFNTDRKNQGAS